jgi:ketosteroid isomerase-like protein
MKNALVSVSLIVVLSVGLVPPAAAQTPEEEVLALTRELLENIYVHPNAHFYAEHVDADVTAYEGTPTRQDGIDFHLFMLRQMAASSGAVQHLELLNPKVQLYGDVAIVTATSQVTSVNQGEVETSYLHETRVWARGEDGWKLVHFHKSRLPEMDND